MLCASVIISRLIKRDICINRRTDRNVCNCVTLVEAHPIFLEKHANSSILVAFFASIGGTQNTFNSSLSYAGVSKQTSIDIRG